MSPLRTIVACHVVLLLAGCRPTDTDAKAVDTDNAETDVVEETEVDDTEEEETDVTPTCGGADLCARTRGECAIDITEADCLSFYDPATTTCANIEGYTTCNCTCLGEATCTLYFDCGTICFEDWC